METGWHIKWALPMPENRALAGVIRRRRERRGWSLSELARRSGVSRQMLGGVEDDQKNPSLDTTSRNAAAFERRRRVRFELIVVEKNGIKSRA